MAPEPRSDVGGPAKSVLTSDNCCLLLIDYQPVPFVTVQSMDGQLLTSNVLGLAKTARIFDVPTILTSVLEESYDGPLLPQLRAVFPASDPIDRTGNNPWDESNCQMLWIAA